jgi:hypothetical protein
MSDLQLKNEMGIDPSEPDYRIRVLAIGAVLGAAVGLLSAYLYLQNLEEDETPNVTAGQGVKIGVLLLGLVRNIADLSR